MDEKRLDRLEQAVWDVNAEAMAVQSLLFGVAMAMKQSGVGLDILKKAFDIADDTAIAGANRELPAGMPNQSARILEILEGMRKRYRA